MKKVLSLILAAALILCFAACSQQPATETPDANATVIKMGTNAAFPPYEFKEGEAFKGIDVDIATEIAKELGAKLEVVDMEFDSIITSVQQGEVDFGMAGMTVTDERKLEVNFTSSYATGVQVVIVPEDSDIKDLDGLEGKKIGTQLGTTGDIYSKDDYGEENVVSYSKGADAIIALKGGDVDAVIIDNEPAKAFVAQNEGLKILETEYAIEDYAIAVKKENTELLDKINAALEKLTADGTIDKIIANYISAE
ncbi:MAG: basic amino acid ABC transporter substrate-binding protein [Clostridia bacterium]|nr:basic amino acid ABC transporter substrate-binding protein [Clostridia bacterium]MBR2877985.1 basic amino acid ABC transporter substrate-binding protein [Clostridia bacterium]MBR3576003.1 basic amino acid ABC transporter substrate-binding protein [Clostridia bacterium]